MNGFCFPWSVIMLTRSGDCLVKGVGLMPVPSSFLDDLFALKGQVFVCHESFKSSRHSFTRCTDAELRARSFRVTVSLVRRNVGLSKVRCMNKIRFLARRGMTLWVYPGGPCEQRGPSSCPLSNDLFGRSNLFVW
jgi:hypothetical protein